VEWVKNDRLVVNKFKDYWIKGLPHLDGVVFKPLPDEAVRLTALRTAQVDITHSLPEKLLPKLMKDEQRGFVLSVNPGVSWRMLIMNTRKPPLEQRNAATGHRGGYRPRRNHDGHHLGIRRGGRPDLG
jgi:peptide/nickel transport system substrate-binding protein